MDTSKTSRFEAARGVMTLVSGGMCGQPGFFDVDQCLRALDQGRRAGTAQREPTSNFRSDLVPAVPRSNVTRGARPSCDIVFMWKVLILQASRSLLDERTEFLIKDRVSFSGARAR
jgi:IS5 family transposase